MTIGDYSSLSIEELLRRSREPLLELRRRGVVRPLNAPAGDYAEWLVAHRVDGTRTPNSTKSYDVVSKTGQRLQVKCRVVRNPKLRSERQLSPFRSWDFDAVVIVLFDEVFAVRRMAQLPRDVVKAVSRHQPHVRGDIVFATDELLASSEAVDLESHLADSSTAEPHKL